MPNRWPLLLCVLLAMGCEDEQPALAPPPAPTAPPIAPAPAPEPAAAPVLDAGPAVPSCRLGSVPTGWTEVAATPAPDPRASAAMAFDERRGVAVLFGGTTGAEYASVLPSEWTGEAWRKIDLPARVPFAGQRAGAAMAYDSTRGVTVMFGGTFGHAHNGETWLWDGSTWQSQHPDLPPPDRYSHQMVFDARRGKAVMFGGYTCIGLSCGLAKDTWEWDGYNWQQVATRGPPPRSDFAFAYDQSRGVAMLFGGNDKRGRRLRDQWEWDGSAWSQVTPSVRPSARSGGAMTYDASRSMVVLYGGWGTRGRAPLSDTWEWNGASWIERSLATTPGPRAFGTMVFDPVCNVSVLFGGGDGRTYPTTTWIYSG